MKSKPSVLIPINRADYDVYVAAADLLQSKLGPNAPDAIALIRHELSRRRPEAIAQEYLYFIGWYRPNPASKPSVPEAASQRMRAGKRNPSIAPASRLRGAKNVRRVTSIPPSIDPTRN